MTTFGDSENSIAFDKTDTEESDELHTSEEVRQSLLAELTQVLKAPVEKKPINLNVETRPGLSLTYRIDIDADDIQSWRRKAALKGRKEEVDMGRFAAAIIWNTNTEMCMHSRPLGITIREKSIGGNLNAVDVVSTVRRLFSDDAHMIAHAMRVMTDAGYDEDGSLLEENPTTT